MGEGDEAERWRAYERLQRANGVREGSHGYSKTGGFIRCARRHAFPFGLADLTVGGWMDGRMR